MRMRSSLAALVLALAAAVPAGADQILVNPGFETGSLSPWYANNGSPVITTAEAHTGLYSVAAYGDDEIRQDFAPVSTADVTQVSFWVQRNGGPFDAVDLFYSDGTSGEFVVSGGSNNWTFFDVTSDLAAGKDLSGIGVYGTSPGPAYLDDFSVLAAVPEPSSLALCGLGAFGVALIARRRAVRSRAGM